MIDTQEFIGANVLNIWKKPEYHPFTTYNPSMAENFDEHKPLLFIGLNPALTKFDKKNPAKAVEYYPFPNQKIAYFSSFFDLANATGFKDSWNYLDLLYIKALQLEVNKIIEDEDLKGDFFVREQLKITKKLLEKLQPKMIVVCNKLAGELMGKNKTENQKESPKSWMGLDFESKEDYHTWNGIPVLFFRQMNRFCKEDLKNDLKAKMIRIGEGL